MYYILKGMKISKVIFRYSWVYDQSWSEKKKGNAKTENYPSQRKVLNYIKKVEKIWKKDEKKILTELSRITGLKWKEDKIICYVIGKCIPFSDPLTIPVYDKYPDYFIDILTHELIHQLFIQNEDLKQLKKAWKYTGKKYKNESQKTKIHIPLHDIHSHIYLKFFNEKRLKRDIKWISFLPDYKKSWEIVQKEGYKNIIKEFKNRIK